MNLQNFAKCRHPHLTNPPPPVRHPLWMALPPSNSPFASDEEEGDDDIGTVFTSSV